MLKNNCRNIGICAHIDAGKTSLTERILFFSGKKQSIGEVFNGEAEMDWMDQEKERGITIISAVTTVYWSGIFNNLGNNKINIIDTPGHIDFTAEVERSLRVLDGVCLVLCSVGGIQPQTEVIWSQINKYNISRLIFINKLDRIGANYNNVCKQIKSVFNIIPIIINKPYYLGNIFTGVIDLVLLKRFIYDNNGNFVIDNNYIPSTDDYNDRNNMIELLVENDDLYLSKYLDNKILNSDINILIRRYTISCKIVPIFCGSVLKNKGIQNFLDGIINYLPSPIDIKNSISDNINNLILNNKFSALVFKVINDDYSGKLSFIRIYSGSINKGDIIYNYNRKTNDRIIRILEIHANKRKDLDTVGLGDIVAVIGLRNVFTGDTLCNKDYPIKLDSISFPKPVISVLIKPKNISDSEKFFSLIKQLAFEDPTIKLTLDNKTNNMIVSGMGELHLEVFLERVKRLTRISFVKENPSVSYRETITNPILGAIGKYIKQSGGRGQYGHVVINAFPNSLDNNIIINNKIKGGVIPNEYIGIIKSSINDFCCLGYLVGGQIVSVTFDIVDGSFHEVDSSEIAFKMATIISMKYIFKHANVVVLEPIMEVYIYSKQEFLGVLTAEILSKRGIINNINNINNNEIKINSFIPLRELFNFSTILRSKTKGSANFFMKLFSYKIVPNLILKKIINNDH